jgi:hypothetical protein
VVSATHRKARNRALGITKAADQGLSENTSVFVDHATLTNRIRGQDVIDPYQVSQARLRNSALWRMLAPDSDSEA